MQQKSLLKWSSALAGALILVSVATLAKQAKAAPFDESAEYIVEPENALMNFDGGGGGGGGSSAWGETIELEVNDPDGKPVPHASVVQNAHQYITDDNGFVKFNPTSSTAPMMVLVPGYQKKIIQPGSGPQRVALQPFTVNAVYLPTIKDGPTLANAMDLIQSTELNAIVVDVKNDDGFVMQGNIGDGVRRLKDAARAKGVELYLIARIVTFKDKHEVNLHPELALRTSDGGIYHGDGGMVFMDPRKEGAWDYVIGIAKQAAVAGFDEIQFDYIRWPTGPNRASIAGFSDIKRAEDRAKPIAGILKKADEELHPLGVFIGADLYGIAAFEHDDSRVGQFPESVTQYLDYVCPMVYPSHYAKPTLSFKNPNAVPGPMVESAVKRFRVRSSEFAVIRPWLQAFTMGAPKYGGPEIRAQIDGSDKSGGIGFMLWNANGHYGKDGLKSKSDKTPPRKVIRKKELP